MSLGYIAWSVFCMRVINDKSTFGGLGYYGENIRAPYLLRLLHGLYWISKPKLIWIIGYAPSLFFIFLLANP